MRSTDTFLNKSFKLLLWKQERRTSIKSMHSSRKCLTVNCVSHPIHWGLSSRLSKYECVNRVWPIRRRERTISSRLESLWINLGRFTWGSISFNLLSSALLQIDCHSLKTYSLIKGLKLIKGILKSVCSRLSDSFAFLSTCTLPYIPTWLGTQQYTIVLNSDMLWCFSNIFCICWFLDIVWFRAWRTDRESEKITNLLYELQSLMQSKAKSIALASAVKIEEPSGRRKVLQASLE